MRFSLLATSRNLPVILLFTAAAALAVTHRSGAAVNAHHGSLLQGLTSQETCSPSPGPAVYCYEVVSPTSNPNDYVYVTGINNGQQINSAYSSSTAGPYTSSIGIPTSKTNSNLTGYGFTPEPDGSLSTYLTGLSSGHTYQVGYQVYPTHTQGVVYDGSHWFPVQDPKQGSLTCAVTEVLGVHDSRIAVGFYETTSTSGTCIKHAFEVYSSASDGSLSPPYTYVDLTPTDPNGGTLDVDSSAATGVNILGDVVGTVTWGSGGSQQDGSWIYRFGKYTTFCLYKSSTLYEMSHTCIPSAGARPTYTNGINFSDLVVGDFIDSLGHQNGFALLTPWKSTAIATVIDAANSINTVLWGVNQATGMYQDVYFTGWATSAGAKPVGIVGYCPAGHCGSTSSPDLPRHRSERH